MMFVVKYLLILVIISNDKQLLMVVHHPEYSARNKAAIFRSKPGAETKGNKSGFHGSKRVKNVIKTVVVVRNQSIRGGKTRHVH